MIVESISIIAITLIIAASFWRAKHSGYSLIILPISFVPVTHLIIRTAIVLFSNEDMSGTIFNVRAPVLLAFADVFSIALTCALTVIFSRQITDDRRRKAYLLVMLVYTVLLGWAYIYNTISVLM